VAIVGKDSGMSLPAERIPVLIGVGHATRRPEELEETAEPADLIGEAVVAALVDARCPPGGPVGVDHLDVVNLLSWSYPDPVGAVAAAAGLGALRGGYSPVGGDQPTRLLVGAARRVADGRSALSVVAGGEALYSRRMWQRSKREPPWTRRGDPPGGRLVLGSGLGHGAFAHGLTQPVQVYPLVENAHRHAAGLDLSAGQRRSAELWAGMSQVAARTPGAWQRSVRRPEDFLSAGPANRPIAHPYLKLMCANPTVDQAAAVVVASLATARRLGVAEEDLVFLWCEAGASDTEEILARPTYASSGPMARVLVDVLDLAGLEPEAVDLLELYSCFPVVPKLALDVLGLADDVQISVAGGLSCYGGPLNAYMVAAAVNMVRALRRSEGETGLLYGNGEYVTKHHALVVGRRPGPAGPVPPTDERADRQRRLDEQSAPELDPAPSGTAVVETYTVLHDRDGAACKGIVVARSGTGRRFVAVTPSDPEVLGVFLDPATDPVGMRGTAAVSGEGNVFRPG